MHNFQERKMPIRDRALHAAAVRVALKLLDEEWAAADRTGGDRAGGDRAGGDQAIRRQASARVRSGVRPRCWTGSR